MKANAHTFVELTVIIAQLLMLAASIEVIKVAEKRRYWADSIAIFFDHFLEELSTAYDQWCRLVSCANFT